MMVARSHFYYAHTTYNFYEQIIHRGWFYKDDRRVFASQPKEKSQDEGFE